jgi:hypothetical protein
MTKSQNEKTQTKVEEQQTVGNGKMRHCDLSVISCNYCGLSVNSKRSFNRT